MNTSDLIVLASGGNGQREARFGGSDIGDDGYATDDDISSFNTLLSNNFNGYPLTYAGETRSGGFGGGQCADDNEGKGGGLTGSNGNASYSYINANYWYLSTSRQQGSSTSDGYISFELIDDTYIPLNFQDFPVNYQIYQ